MYNPRMQIFISLGSGQDIGIAEDNHLAVRDYTGYTVDLGLATVDRMGTLQDYIQRLKIHAVKEEK